MVHGNHRDVTVSLVKHLWFFEAMNMPLMPKAKRCMKNMFTAIQTCYMKTLKI